MRGWDWIVSWLTGATIAGQMDEATGWLTMLQCCGLLIAVAIIWIVIANARYVVDWLKDKLTGQ